MSMLQIRSEVESDKFDERWLETGVWAVGWRKEIVETVCVCVCNTTGWAEVPLSVMNTRLLCAALHLNDPLWSSSRVFIH